MTYAQRLRFDTMKTLDAMTKLVCFILSLCLSIYTKESYCKT